MKTTQTWFQIRIGAGVSAGYDPKHFETEAEARAFHKAEYLGRKKNDGHDEYWNSIPVRIEKVTKTTETVAQIGGKK